MVKGHLRFDDVEGLPDWASWSSGAQYLPEPFYKSGGLELAITNIESVASEIDKMDPTLVLAFGLALQGLVLGQACQDPSNRPKGIPDWVQVLAEAEDVHQRFLDIMNYTV